MTEHTRNISVMLMVIFIAAAIAAAALTATAPTAVEMALTTTSYVEGDCIPHTEWAEYTLQNGESLTTLARKLGISVEILSEANCTPIDAIADGSTVYVPAFPAS